MRCSKVRVKLEATQQGLSTEEFVSDYLKKFITEDAKGSSIQCSN
jgi:hypothetical protein